MSVVESLSVELVQELRERLNVLGYVGGRKAVKVRLGQILDERIYSRGLKLADCKPAEIAKMMLDAEKEAVN